MWAASLTFVVLLVKTVGAVKILKEAQGVSSQLNKSFEE